MIADDPFSRVYVPRLRGALPPAPAEATHLEANRDRVPTGGDDSGGAASSTQELHFNNGVVKIDIDASGVRVEELATGRLVQLEADGSFTFNNFADMNVRMTDDGLAINTGTKSVEIFFSAIAQNMGVRTIDVCSSGSPASMDIIGSDPY